MPLKSLKPLNVHLVDPQGIGKHVLGRHKSSSEPRHIARCHGILATAVVSNVYICQLTLLWLLRYATEEPAI